MLPLVTVLLFSVHFVHFGHVSHLRHSNLTKYCCSTCIGLLCYDIVAAATTPTTTATATASTTTVLVPLECWYVPL